MKRKLLNGLLLASAFVVAGTFQSCKDYEADFQNEWKQQNYTLEEEIALLKNRVGDLEKAQEGCKAECNRKIQQILDILGVWDPVQRGTMSQTLLDLLSRVDNLENAPGTPGCDCTLTEEKVKQLIYTALKENGWPTDDNGNLRHVDLAGMEKKVAELANDVSVMLGRIEQLENYITYLKGLDLENRINQIEAWIAAHKDTPGCSCTNWTEDQIKQLIQRELDIYKLEVNQALSSLRSYVDSQDTALGQRIDGIQTLYNSLESRLTQAETDALNALTQANANSLSITNLELLVAGMQSALDAAEGRIDELENTVGLHTTDIQNLRTDYNALANRVSALETQYAALDAKFSTLESQLGTLSDQVNTNTTSIANILQQLKNFASKEALNALEQRVAANEAAIAALQGDVNTLFGIYNRLNSLVTGIIVQAVYNPLFGTFSMPLGIQSNMLLNYYGRYTGVKPLVFPSQTSSEELPMLDAEEVANLGNLLQPITLNSGEYMMEGNMGKVYLTINPSNIALDGVQLSLESSNGTTAPVELRNVTSSWENLTFGYSRANGNGFYEADAVMPLTSGNIYNTELKLADGLKGAVKDVLSDRSRATVFNLLKTVFQTINQDLPAYAVKTSWKADDGQGEKRYNVYSNYNIAAVTFRPLSYNTYRGQSIDHRFKHYGPLKSVKEYLNSLIKNDKFHFSLSANINIKPVEVRFHLAEIQDITLSFNGTINAQTSGLEFDIYDDNHNLIGHGVTGPVNIPVNGSDLNEFLATLGNQMKDIINQQLPVWDNQMKTEFNSAMSDLIGEVNGEVNKALKDLEANINGQMDKILNDLKNDIANKTQGLVDNLNKFLDKYNQVIDKLNDFLADPNHYLQVAMLYSTGGGNFHRLSTALNDPTILNPAGGDAIELIATSYSAELAAPAYRKFVAISKAWDNKGNLLSPAQIQALNSGMMCQVVTGRAKRVALPTTGMKSGYTYQIVYVGLDYHGYTSTERYYVRMK